MVARVFTIQVSQGFLTNNLIEKFLSGNGNGRSSSNNKNVQQEPMDISTPYNTVHVTHVGFDSNTGEFTGLPREWTALITQSGITKQEQENNPQVNRKIQERERIWNK